MENILSLLIWIPILGAIVVALLPRDKDNLIRYTSAAFTGLQFVIAIVLWRKFDPSDGSMQFMERYEWIPSLNISLSLSFLIRIYPILINKSNLGFSRKLIISLFFRSLIIPKLDLC